MIFIPGNVPSVKNSKKPVSLPGRKHTTLVPSDAVRRYLKTMGIKKYSTRSGVENYANRPNQFRKAVGNYFQGVHLPAIVKFHFVRDSRRKFDFHNAVQIIADLLVAHGCLEDDNMDCFVPMPMYSAGKWYTVNPKEPGVWVEKVEGAAVTKDQYEALADTQRKFRLNMGRRHREDRKALEYYADEQRYSSREISMLDRGARARKVLGK